jgi:MAE_28990/MAE_18760-like HEPN
MVAELSRAFEERQAEVSTYIEFLQSLEAASRSGVPKLENVDHAISADQQKILYSSVYLQLYNLVESTITRCLDAVISAATASGIWYASDLSESLRSEWVKGIAQTHKELNLDNRFRAAMELCNHLIDNRPITVLSIGKGGGGNWDDTEIENIIRRVGFTLNVSQPVYQGIKRQFKDGMGALSAVKKYRNDLAHGSISFVECANEITVTDLKNLYDNTTAYLREVVGNFINYIEGFEYLKLARRPGRTIGEHEISPT